MPTTPPLREFGATPWGRDWVRRVQPLTVTKPNPVLPRGRSLARGDAVQIDEVEHGSIRCRVSVGRGTESVSISAPLFSVTETASVAALLERSDGLAAGSGDLPDALHSEMIRVGLNPLPDSAVSACTCRGRTTPCVHVVAATYAVGLMIDQSPVTALTLRGFDVGAQTGTSNSVQPRWIPIDDVDATDYFGCASPSATQRQPAARPTA